MTTSTAEQMRVDSDPAVSPQVSPTTVEPPVTPVPPVVISLADASNYPHQRGGGPTHARSYYVEGKD